MADPPEREGASTPPNGVDVQDPLAGRFAGVESVVGVAPTERTGHYRDIAVIGASAGGVQTLDQLVERLPPELPASVFVVLHLAAGGRSVLPSILARMGPLPAEVPSEQQLPKRGHIYVAPPDRHPLLVGEEVRLTGGPCENGHGPAIDPLFRIASCTYGPRVIAVVLSGTLDDGDGRCPHGSRPRWHRDRATPRGRSLRRYAMQHARGRRGGCGAAGGGDREQDQRAD